MKLITKLVLLATMLVASPSQAVCPNFGLVALHIEHIQTVNKICIKAEDQGIINDGELCGILMDDVIPPEMISCLSDAYGEDWYFITEASAARISAMLKHIRERLNDPLVQFRIMLRENCRPDTYTGACESGPV